MPGGLWEVPGVVSGDPGGTQGRRKNGGGSLGASWDGPGSPLGWFWRYGAILGSVLGGQNVAIPMVLDGFLRCHIFSLIF